MRGRLPKNYDGCETTSRHMGDLLSPVLSKIARSVEVEADHVLASWPTLIGPQLAPMTQAVSYQEGTLTIRVKNSTLHSLLNAERQRLLTDFKRKFPNTPFATIVFRIG